MPRRRSTKHRLLCGKPMKQDHVEVYIGGQIHDRQPRGSLTPEQIAGALRRVYYGVAEIEVRYRGVTIR